MGTDAVYSNVVSQMVLPAKTGQSFLPISSAIFDFHSLVNTFTVFFGAGVILKLREILLGGKKYHILDLSSES